MLQNFTNEEFMLAFCSNSNHGFLMDSDRFVLLLFEKFENFIRIFNKMQHKSFKQIQYFHLFVLPNSSNIFFI